MRIAVLIIALILGFIVGLQSCTVAGLSGIAQDETTGQAAAMGGLVALLFIIGAAFSLSLPKISVSAFGLAAVSAFGASTLGRFEDMQVWGIVAVVLGVMSYFGVRELRKKEQPKSENS